MAFWTSHAHHATEGMRKKIVLIGLIAVFIFLGIFSYKTWFITFAVTKFLSGPKEGKQGIVRSIIIPWRNYQLHFHHWLLALIIGLVCLMRNSYIVTPEVFYGSLSAIIFQGIYCYEDWYRIIKKKNTLSALESPMALEVKSDQAL